MSDPEHQRTGLPEEPIHRIVAPLQRFLHVEAAGGIALFLATSAALILANSRFSAGFLGFWETHAGLSIGGFQLEHSLQHWINDGLMALFFFVVGLEVKREFVLGQLRDPRQAALPIAAALGGMIAPAGIYLLLQGPGPASRGWGIPMATDIAFVVGCMALLGRRIPARLRVAILTLAIVDDIGAILVIALGYSGGLSLGALAAGLLGIALVSVLARLGVRSFLVYTALGLAVWLAFLASGVHATIAGVILGIMTPARSYLSSTVLAGALRRAQEVLAGEWEAETDRAARVQRLRWAAREVVSPLEYLENTLHPWVSFLVMPLFALANAGVVVQLDDLTQPVALAIAAGLLLGKPLGIVSFCWLSVRLGIARLPAGVSWPQVLGGGILGGIGFTMSLFIAGLALDAESLGPAKLGILLASWLAAILGMGLLAWIAHRTRPPAG